MGRSYTRQKLWEALSSLCGGGSIQQRLNYAGVPLLVLSREDFDGDEQDDFEAIMAGLTAYGHGGEMGTLAVTTGELDDETAERLARDILNLAASVSYDE